MNWNTHTQNSFDVYDTEYRSNFSFNHGSYSPGEMHQQQFEVYGNRQRSSLDIGFNPNLLSNLSINPSNPVQVNGFHESQVNQYLQNEGANHERRFQDPDVVLFHLERVRITIDLSNKLEGKGNHNTLFYLSSSGEVGNNKRKWKERPTDFHWKWEDPTFVKLPFSSLNKTGQNGRLKWDVIQEQLLMLPEAAHHLGVAKAMKKAISSYSPKLVEEFNFKILQDEELAQMLVHILPAVVDHALKLQSRLWSPIPLLKRGESRTIYLTRNLTCSLLANAFFSTFPHKIRGDELPHFHFLQLFHDGGNGASRAKTKVEKLKCVLEYFSQMASGHEDNSIISFERRHRPTRVDWAKSKETLCQLGVDTKEKIEEADGMLQVDFANRFVGGGVLSEGMVMEEIRFTICPELIVSRLFTEVLGHDEVLVVTGTKQFTSYSGYRATFQCRGPHRSVPSKKDNLDREIVQVVAMDAYNFKPENIWTQYQKSKIDRELHKCYVAFLHGKQNGSPVATGNWGCGAFNGDPELKLLIQWISASEASRPSIIFHVDDEDPILKIGKFLTKKQISVGKLYRILLKYEAKGNIKSSRRTSVFDFVRSAV